MPLVRIDLRKGKGAAYRNEVGRVVYEALVGVGVPKKDRFQVIGEISCSTRTISTSKGVMTSSFSRSLGTKAGRSSRRGQFTKPSSMGSPERSAFGLRTSSSTSSR